ncbi:zinc metallochaperone AztD [Mycolicibacterium sp. HK-90]|uniref:zinc metallochaperone AztD n=1 Tax=Mycolicibacterium sp. HK-90 TaxID=3056937 RepID=UPI0026588EB9|nr:zinc metallochaperone AztD [Mycolicibacterium sp. HK-90]WKG02900.1 zinc metallochaperone AztD [Mycolicibacterium sp. HK-90]
MVNPVALTVALGTLTLAASLAGCGSDPQQQAQPTEKIAEPLVVTYDGGLYVLDGATLEVKSDVPLDGFLRVNPAGDDAHVLVTTNEGFRLLDASTGELTEITFSASEPGHVVPHGETTALFADGSGEITVFDPHDLGSDKPETKTMSAPKPHHGVAVVLSDGSWVRSEGDPDERSGAVAFDANQAEIARSAECPGIHGETVVEGETIVFGCENGVLTYSDRVFTKVAAPGEYGRVGTVRGHDESAVALGDFKVDPDAELERPNRFALIDTASNQLRLVTLPPSVSYSFRSLARGPHAEALVLGTDGKLYVVDPVSGDTVKSIAVTEPWIEPDDWQQPRPSVFARGHDVYVTDPATKKLHVVDVEAGAVTESVTLQQAPNELSGAVGHEH